MILYINASDIKQFIIADLSDSKIIKKISSPELHLKNLVNFLNEHNIDSSQIKEVHTIISGQSSTALRSIITILNTFAFVHNWQLFGYDKSNENDKIIIEQIISQKLKPVQKGNFLKPIYQTAPKITQTNKDQLMRKK